APTATHVMLGSSRQQATDHAWIRIHTGRESPGFDKVPFEVLAMTRVEDLKPGKSAPAWLSLADDLVRAVRGVHGVIVVTRDDQTLSDELWRVPPKLRRELGTKYVRPPRWGNYLDARAIAAA